MSRALYEMLNYLVDRGGSYIIDLKKSCYAGFLNLIIVYNTFLMSAKPLRSLYILKRIPLCFARVCVSELYTVSELEMYLYEGGSTHYAHISNSTLPELVTIQIPYFLEDHN